MPWTTWPPGCRVYLKVDQSAGCTSVRKTTKQDLRTNLVWDLQLFSALLSTLLNMDLQILVTTYQLLNKDRLPHLELSMTRRDWILGLNLIGIVIVITPFLDRILEVPNP